MITITLVYWLLAGFVGALLVAFDCWRAGDLDSITIGDMIVGLFLTLGGYGTLLITVAVTIVFEIIDFCISNRAAKIFDYKLIKFKKDD